MRIYLILVIVVLLAACSDVREYVQGDLRKPAELKEIQPAVEVKLDWSVQLESVPEVHDYRLRAAMHSGVVYVAESRGRLAAYKSNNGNLLWDKLLGVVFSGGVSAGDELVVIATAEAEVIAFSKQDGVEKWRARVSSEVLRPPVITSRIVVVHTSDDKLVGVDINNGKRIWVASFSYPSLSLRGTSAPVIWENLVISGLANGKIVAVELETGKKAWESPLVVASGRTELERLVDLDGKAVVDDGVLYVPSFQGRIAAVNLENGQIIWARDMSSYSDLSLLGNVLYVHDEFSQIWALDRSSGATLWRQDKLHGRMLTSPMLQDKYLVVGDFEGYLHWLSLDDGKLAARVSLKQAQNLARLLGQVGEPEEDAYIQVDPDFGVLSEPFIDGNRLYVIDRSGVLAAYKLAMNK